MMMTIIMSMNEGNGEWRMENEKRKTESKKSHLSKVSEATLLTLPYRIPT